MRRGDFAISNLNFEAKHNSHKFESFYSQEESTRIFRQILLVSLLMQLPPFPFCLPRRFDLVWLLTTASLFFTLAPFFIIEFCHDAIR